MLLRGQPAHVRKPLGPTQSPRVPPQAGLALKVLLDPRLLVRDLCVAACHHPQRRIMWLLVPIILSPHSSRLRQLMRSHSRLCTNSSRNSHPSLTVSQTPTTVRMLAVFPPHLPHHQLASVVRQARDQHKVLFLHIVFVLAALLLRCAPL